jgi:ribosome maturation factor RimP
MIPQQEIVDKISSIVLPILQESLLQLVDVEFLPSGRRWLLRIYIDREGGVTIADCEWVSRELGRLMEVEEVVDHPYVLEVSSPGLTRPLKKKEHFESSKGKKARIVTSLPVDGKNEFTGEIAGVAGDEVEVKIDGTTYRIPLEAIKKARLEFDL